MAKKKDLLCASCYKPITGEHFTVPAGSTTMAFHKDAHECAAASSTRTTSHDFSQRTSRGGGAAQSNEFKYEGTK